MNWKALGKALALVFGGGFVVAMAVFLLGWVILLLMNVFGPPGVSFVLLGVILAFFVNSFYRKFKEDDEQPVESKPRQEYPNE